MEGRQNDTARVNGQSQTRDTDRATINLGRVAISYLGSHCSGASEPRLPTTWDRVRSRLW